MSDYTIIDRRTNPKGKNLANRQRFINRTRSWIKDKVRKSSANRSITSNEGESISVTGEGIDEPSFGYDGKVGDWNRVLPGNKEFIKGDKIKRPTGGSGQGGTQGSDTGDGEDSFVFSISKEEYFDILFEDLELPNLIKESEAASVTTERKRAGFTTTGSPNNLDLEKSFRNALGRRIALAFPIDKKIKELEDRLLYASDEEKINIASEIESLKKRRAAISFIDQIDVRYKRFSNVPLPNCQAVVFCLMDVSGSMGEKEKEIAKRFFLLLYLFLQRQYSKVDIVFVRHTTEAKECSEDEFFNGKETGGTVVSSGVKKVNEIMQERYPLDAWNVYCVQASDGDNFDNDTDELFSELELVLPKCQYYVYNEVLRAHSGNIDTNVFSVMKELEEKHSNLSIVNIRDVVDVVPTFRKIFTKSVKGK